METQLSKTDNKSLRKIVTALVRYENGGCGQPGWGNPDKKPVWWSATVKWGPRGVQAGVTAKEMREVIKSYFSI